MGNESAEATMYCSTMFFCYEGCITGISAAAGAVGYGVLNACGWTVAGIGMNNFVQSMAIGGAILNCPIACVLASATAAGTSHDSDLGAKISIASCPLAVGGAVDGLLNSLVGTSILGLLHTGTHTGWAAAAGAIGGGILSVGLGIAGICCVCIGGTCYICGEGASGEAQLVKVPKENLTRNRNGNIEIRSLENVEVVDPKSVGINVTTSRELQQLYSKNTNIPIATVVSSPKQQDDMQRNAPKLVANV